jgi:hypothetical protein
MSYAQVKERVVKVKDPEANMREEAMDLEF